MSTSGNTYPNAQAEICLKMLKVEDIYLRAYGKFDEVAARPPYFIDEIYIEQRF